MEMSTADVFKRSINKMHLPFCFELQGDGTERRALALPPCSEPYATCSKFVFQARRVTCNPVMLQRRTSVVASRFAQSLITH
jgi:hypothetical protein